ncbi:hypothetical protein PFISCL1PPCAC_9755, partial [Pristionchus fissidentatus]
MSISEERIAVFECIKRCALGFSEAEVFKQSLPRALDIIRRQCDYIDCPSYTKSVISGISFLRMEIFPVFVNY